MICETCQQRSQLSVDRRQGIAVKEWGKSGGTLVGPYLGIMLIN
ncbi:hypothetical protein yfred0001_33840 [Yersinia frederiksenii ATCC 33641]|nr:hypothetical protein yfred0001_33840 [Yersinia frederiksenii ATCC 33641]